MASQQSPFDDLSLCDSDRVVIASLKRSPGSLVLRFVEDRWIITGHPGNPLVRLTVMVELGDYHM